jgi:hypothetical protein
MEKRRDERKLGEDPFSLTVRLAENKRRRISSLFLLGQTETVSEKEKSKELERETYSIPSSSCCP